MTTKKKKTTDKKSKPCPICEGTGQVDDPEGYELLEHVECHSCSGTGKVLPKSVKRCSVCLRIKGKHYDFCPYWKEPKKTKGDRS